MNSLRKEWKCLAALCGVAFVLFAVTWGRVSPALWGLPINYDGDAVQFLTWVKAASEGEYYPFLPVTVDRLGAPFGANWNDYPMYEKPLTVLVGLCASLFGVFLAGNLAVLAAHVTAVLSFYLVCRFLKVRREWAFMGAILFGFAYYNLWRGLQHLQLAYTYTLPPALLSCALIARSARVRIRNGPGKFCIGVACVMGLSNPYNLNLYLQFMVFALLAQGLSSRRRENLQVGGLCLVSAVVAFALVNGGTFIYRLQHGANSEGIVRIYYESEQYGLKLMECFIPPPGHNVRLLGEIGETYDQAPKISGEVFSPYLGIVAIVGLLWIAL